MAGHGPPPKNPAQRRRRNAAPARQTLEPDDRGLAVPLLPGDHLPQTLTWYLTWASSPQATRFLATDWQRLHMLAPLVDQYWANPTKDLMGEIRLNEAKLGATEEDRLRLRWDVGAPGASPAAPSSTPKAPARKDEALRLLRGEAG